MHLSGDCYVAVTGLPKPQVSDFHEVHACEHDLLQHTHRLSRFQPDHAAITCKFAADCLRKMYTTVRELIDALGDDTAELGMRAGINSGPVTAGVLRGQKSCVQL